MKKPIFYLLISLLVLSLGVLFLGLIPQQNLALGCEVDGDCDPSAPNYCCGDNVCNDLQYYFCNYLVNPPGCAPDFTEPTKLHIDTCTYGCSNGSCNAPPCTEGEFQYNECFACNQSQPVLKHADCSLYYGNPQSDSGCSSWCAPTDTPTPPPPGSTLTPTPPGSTPIPTPPPGSTSTPPPVSGNTNIYVDPVTSYKNQTVTVTATGTSSCSTNISQDFGLGLTGCTSNGGFTCAGGNPKDGNPCWWRWGCTATNISNSTSWFNASGTNCYSARSYSVLDPACTIQGKKVLMPGNQDPSVISNYLVALDYLSNGPTTTNQPYSFVTTAGNHMVTASGGLFSYSIGYTACTNATNCHNLTPVTGSTVSVNCPAGGYVDLYWHYTALPTWTPTPTYTPIPTPTPPGPPNISGATADCRAPGLRTWFSWGAVPGATSYKLFADKDPDSWSGSCASLNPGDYCINNIDTPATSHDSVPGPYNWQVSSCNGSNCGAPFFPPLSFTCVTTSAWIQIQNGDVHVNR